MATPASRKAAIAQATQQARQQQLVSREQYASRVAELLDRGAKAIRLELLSLQDGGRDVLPGQIPTVRALITGQTDALLQRYSRLLVSEALPASARIGASVLPAAAGDIATESMVRSTLAYLASFRAADGLQLSDRVWRVVGTARNQLGEAIENGIVRGQSSYQAAQAYLQRGDDVPMALRQGMDARQADRLARAADQLLTNPKADVLYAAQRVLRTESNRAYTESYVASVAQHPDVIGVRFTLSPNHPRPDICDMYATANLHGLGPGVYPPGKHPYPAHPQTLSYLQPVFVDEVTDRDRAGQQDALTWLRAQHADLQTAVLGGQRKAEALRAGQLDASEITAPWKQVAARLGMADG